MTDNMGYEVEGMSARSVRWFGLAGLMGFALSAAGQPVAGQTGAAPAFAVSAIKASGPASGNGMSIRFLPGGRFAARNVTLRVLVKIAYDLDDDQLSGGPAWTAFKRFDVDAKPDGPASDENNMTAPERQQYREALLQGLLHDRFQLKLHGDTKEMSIYVLDVGKDGPKVKEALGTAIGPPIKGRAGSMVATGASMADLANELKERAGRPVEDMTGLHGRYDFKLDWTPDALAPVAAAASDAGDSGPDLFTAIQQQLGLKLDSRKRMAAYEVIENVQLPTEN
jgi:uncharacterized protein (TIGR03435 family)